MRASAIPLLADSPLLTGAAAALAGIVFVGAAAWGWQKYRVARRRRLMAAQITAVAVDHLRDVLVPDGNGGVLHVDWLLLTPRGILLLDLREVRGNVFGSDQMTEWTVMRGAIRTTFANPQGALYDRLAAVRAIVGTVPVDGRIVFARTAAFPKGVPRLALGIDALATEFPLGDPDVAGRATTVFSDGWQQLRTVSTPSPLVRPKSVVDD